MSTACRARGTRWGRRIFVRCAAILHSLAARTHHFERSLAGPVEVDFLTQPPLGAYPKAVAHQQHPDPELRVHSWTARVTVEGLELASQLAEIEEAVNPAQQVIRR